MLLEISISQSDCGDLTLFQTIQEVIGRINIGSVKSFSQIGLQASGKMKSVGNGGILNGSLQMLHIHVLFVTPLGTSHMA